VTIKINCPIGAWFESRDFLLNSFGPSLISGISKATDFTFDTLIVHDKNESINDKLPPDGAWHRSRGLFKIRDL